MRYTRLRTGDPFPFAERIASAPTGSVLVFDDALLLSPRDVWRLMGLAERNAAVALDSERTVKAPETGILSFLWRSAQLRLKRYLYPRGAAQARAFAVNKPLLRRSEGISKGSFHEKKTYYDYLRSVSGFTPVMIIGESFLLRGADMPLLGTGLSTGEAFRYWHQNKKFPDWFSGKFLVFHVAQLAVYYGALVAFVSPLASLIVFGFALMITPGFFFGKLPWRRPFRIPGILVFRFLLYFAG